MKPLLEVRDLTLAFGGLVALAGVSFTVGQGQIVGLIGPNGAGKTTLFNCLCGLYAPSDGSVLLRGRTLKGMKPHRIAALGMGRTFQNLALFGSLTVLENVLTAGHCRTQAGFLASALNLTWVRQEEERARERAAVLLDELALTHHADTNVASLPFGTRKRVELARALMGEPALLLLDEPAGGLNHAEVEEFGALLLKVRARHAVTLLLVEHHVALIMSVSDRIVVLHFGCKIAEGTPAEIGAEPAVVEAYFGARPQ